MPRSALAAGPSSASCDPTGGMRMRAGRHRGIQEEAGNPFVEWSAFPLLRPWHSLQRPSKDEPRHRIYTRTHAKLEKWHCSLDRLIRGCRRGIICPSHCLCSSRGGVVQVVVHCPVVEFRRLSLTVSPGGKGAWRLAGGRHECGVGASPVEVHALELL
jgi:hypothetical protein